MLYVFVIESEVEVEIVCAFVLLRMLYVVVCGCCFVVVT